MRLNEIKTVTEGIAIGNSYNVIKYDPLSNMRITYEVKVVDYIKSPGKRDVVVYKGKDGKTRNITVNVFKARMEQAALSEDDVDGIVYKVFVNTHGDPEDSWATNGKKYEAAEDAAEAAKDLFMRWTAVKFWRVMDAEQQTVYAEGP